MSVGIGAGDCVVNCEGDVGVGEDSKEELLALTFSFSKSRFVLANSEVVRSNSFCTLSRFISVVLRSCCRLSTCAIVAH